jgi:hypothetical protein
MNGEMMNEDYPLFMYIYDKDGYHRGSTRLEDYKATETAFMTTIRSAIQEKREVRITDTGDLMVFHSKNGHIKWDGERKHTCAECRCDDE